MEPQPNPVPTPSPAPNPPQPPAPPTPPSPTLAPPTAPAPAPVPPSPTPASVPPEPLAAAGASPGQVVVGGFDPSATAATGSSAGAPPPDKDALSFGLPDQQPKRQISRKLLIGLTSAFVLIGGLSAFYFGYYMNPSTIYSQSLKNTGKGYDKLVEYVDTQSKQDYKGLTANGTYAYKQGENTADGKFGAKVYDNTGEYTMDFGYAGIRVDGEIRTIKSSGGTPDVYVKVNGLDGIGAMLGSAEIDQTLAKVNNQWIFIDHTLLDQLTAQASGGAEEPKSPTNEEVMDEVRAFGMVNQEYLYTTDTDKAVLKVVKEKGKESFNDRTAYRYEVGLNKDNVKKYIDAQKAALNKSKLGKWLKDNNYEKEVNQSFDDMKKGADSIKESDTFDMWMDTQRRIVYKVRFTDTEKSKEYVDLGLDYTGGDTYPFFMAGDFEGGDFKMVASLDAKANKLGFTMNANMSSSGTFTLKSDYKPSNDKVKVEKPEGVKTLPQVWQELGLGDFNSQLQTLTPPAATDPGIQANGLEAANEINGGLSGLSAAAGLPGRAIERLFSQ